MTVLRIVIVYLRKGCSGGRRSKSERIESFLREQSELLFHGQRRYFLPRILDGKKVRNNTQNAVVIRGFVRSWLRRRGGSRSLGQNDRGGKGKNCGEQRDISELSVFKTN